MPTPTSSSARTFDESLDGHHPGLGGRDGCRHRDLRRRPARAAPSGESRPRRRRGPRRPAGPRRRRRVVAEAKSAEYPRRAASPSLAQRLKAGQRTDRRTRRVGVVTRRRRAPQPAPQPAAPRPDLLAAAAVAAALTPPSPAAPQADPVRRSDTAGRAAGRRRPRNGPAQGVHPGRSRRRPAARAPRPMADLRRQCRSPGRNEYRARSRRNAGAGASGKRRRLTLLAAASLQWVSVGVTTSRRPSRERRVRARSRRGAQPAERARGVRRCGPRPEPRSPEQVVGVRQAAVHRKGLRPSTVGPAAMPHGSEDDQLDIPAFLRRQAT